MAEKKLILPKEKLEEIAAEFGTPFIIYDEKGIRQTLREINSAFSWAPEFREYFAVKACPNPDILQICKEEGAGLDCSSTTELTLAEKVGIKGERIMFTSNNTPASEYRQAKDLGAIINLDDITHIEFFEKNVGKLPEYMFLRLNPGGEKVGNSIIGNPIEAKYGHTREQIFEALKIMREKGVKRFGIHTMVASNELNLEYHIDTARMLFRLAGEIRLKLGIKLEAINLGGGWGVDYHPDQKPINPKEVGDGVKNAYTESFSNTDLRPQIFMENGRFITGPHGQLVMKAIHEKHIYREYIGVDATKEDFARPAAYGIYQHILVPGKEEEFPTEVYDVVGSLCENNDKFAIQRNLPKINMGDKVVLCDAGAHGGPMGGNYNGKLRCKWLLSKINGDVELIKRAETQDDYFATLNFPGSKFFKLKSA